MQISPAHQRAVHRSQPGTNAATTKGTSRSAADTRSDNKSIAIDSGENDPPPASGGMPFSNPMDDADTLMRAILANYVEHKPDEKAVGRSQAGAGEVRTLNEVKQQFQSRFADNASSKEAFHSLMQKSFGESYDYAKAENIRQQTLNGDFSWMPEIKLVDGSTLADTSGQQGAGVGHGAYSKDNDTIYLSRELLASDPKKAEEILTEEVGHALDARLNVKDAAGDEGSIFSTLSHGGEISDAELTDLRSENDSGSIIVDGKEVEVEYGWNPLKKIKKAVKKVTRAVKKTVKKVTNAVTKTVKKVGSAIKSHVSNVWDAAKKGFNKVMQSELLGKIMTVAQFIPIPVVQLIAKGYNLVKAGYTAYQGVKHGSIGMVLSGVAGAFGGAAKLGGALGATGAWVGKAANVGKMMGSASAAHQMISQKNFSGAASLLAGQFGADSKAASFLNTAARVENVRQAVKNDNLFGAISGATSLLQDYTGPEGDAFLSTINKHTNVIQQIDTARRTGDYSQALNLLHENFGSNLSIPPATKATLERIESGLKYAQTVDKLIDNKDYAAAANMLLDTAASSVQNPQTQARLQSFAGTLTTVDSSVKAYNDGRFNDAIGLAANAIGQPLTDNSRNFVDTLQSRANTVENLVSAVKSRDVETSTALLRELTGGEHGQVINLIEKAGNTANNIDSLRTAIDNNDFTQAIGLANTLSQSVAGKGLAQDKVTTVQQLVTAVENRDVGQSAALLNTLTNGKADNVFKFVQQADSAVQRAEDLKTAIDNNDFTTAASLANSLSNDISGRALPEQVTTAAKLIDAVQSGDVNGSTSLLRELTNGKHSHIIDVFESVGTATHQVRALETAIENKNYSEASSIATALSQQVLGKDNALSDTLSTMSDVLAGKVQIRMDSLPGTIPGMTPGINPGAGRTGGLGGSLFQPTMANGFGVTGFAGQTALAQAIQPGIVEVPASSRLELSSVELAAVERIEKNLEQGLTDWDVGRSELQDINQTLSSLNAEQKTNVIASLTSEQLQSWGNEIDGFRGGLSDADQVELFTSLASDLDSIQLNRVYDAFGTKLVEKVHANAASGITTPEGLSPEEKELYLDLGQMSLDIVGIFDPTPVSDGTNTVISLFRGKWLDAGLSAVSMVPYIGDLAKAGKLGSWAKTIDNVISMAAKNPEFAKAVEPILNKIGGAIDSLPSGLQDKLGVVKSKIDDFSGATSGLIVRNFDNLEDFNRAANVPAEQLANQVLKHGNYSWTTDSLGRVTKAEGVVDLTANGRKTHGVSTTDIGKEGVEGDVGFHLVGEQFNGPINKINVVPGNGSPLVLSDGTHLKNINQGRYYHEFEKVVADLATDPKNKVEISIETVYLANNSSGRPDAFITKYRNNNGEWIENVFKNKAGG